MSSWIGAVLTVLLVGAPLPMFSALFPAHPRPRPDGGRDYYYLVGYGLYSFWHWTVMALVLGFSGTLSPEGLGACLVACYLPLLHGGLRRRCLASARRLDQEVRAYLTSAPLFGPVLGVHLGFFLYRALRTTPSDYDTMAYHLPFVGEWISRGQILVHPHFQQSAVGYYPSSWAALSSLFVLAVRDDTLLQFPVVLGYALFLVVLTQLGVHFGATRLAAAFSPLLVGSLPLTHHNVISSLHVDLPLACFALAAVIFLTLPDAGPASREPHLRLFVLLAASLALGVKSTGIVYVPLLLVVLAGSGQMSRGWLRQAITSRPRTTVVALTVLAVGTGTAWYVRNLLQFDNPLGIVTVSIGPYVLWSGSIAPNLWHTTIARLFDPFKVQDYRVVAFTLRQELGLLFVVATLVAVARLLLRIRQRAPAHLLVLLALAFVLYVVTPFTGDNGTHNWQLTPWIGQAFRYGYVLLGLCAVAVAHAASASLAVSVGVAALALVGVVYPLHPGGVLVAAAAVGAWYLVPRLRERGLSPRVVGAIAVAGLLCLPAFAIHRSTHRPEWLTRIHDVVEAPDVQSVVVLDSHRSFAAYGSDFSTTVVVARDAREAIELVEKGAADAILYGPNTIPNRDTTDTFLALLRSGRLRLVFDVDPRREPALFVPRPS